MLLKSWFHYQHPSICIKPSAHLAHPACEHYITTLMMKPIKMVCRQGVTNCFQISYTLPTMLFEHPLAKHLKSKLKEHWNSAAISTSNNVKI